MGHNQNSAYQDQTWIIKQFIRVFTVCFNLSQNLNKNEEKNHSRIGNRNRHIQMVSVVMYSKTCLKRPLQKDQKLAFKTDYRLMQVKSIAECSKRAFCNTFDLH